MEVNPSSRVSRREALLTSLFILLLSVAALTHLVPPPVVRSSAPATEFSAERALDEVRVIAREAHPLGSAANVRARPHHRAAAFLGAGRRGAEGREYDTVGH